MDTVANMLTQLRNGSDKRLDVVEVSGSKTVGSILKILNEEGFVGDFEENGRKYSVKLLYEGNDPVLSKLERVSKSGRRVYTGWKELKPVMGGRGIGILSTPDGVMTIESARKKKVGGEYICKIW